MSVFTIGEYPPYPPLDPLPIDKNITNYEEFVMYVCGDFNQKVIFYPEKNYTIKQSFNGQIVDYTITGVYDETVKTRDVMPECVDITKKENRYDFKCITKRCSKIWEFNILNGTVREIWNSSRSW